jgi:hypothetical protein
MKHSNKAIIFSRKNQFAKKKRSCRFLLDTQFRSWYIPITLSQVPISMRSLISPGKETLILDDPAKIAATSDEVMVKALRQHGGDKRKLGLDYISAYPGSREWNGNHLPHATIVRL